MKISQVPVSPRPKFDSPPRIDGAVLILPDVEIPFHNAEFVNHCIEFAALAGIRQCIWAGDVVRLESLSPFIASEKDTNDELEEVGTILPALLGPFERILWVWGNHDARLGRQLDRELDSALVARLFVRGESALEFYRKVEISDYYFCEVGDEWLIEHPKATSVIAARAATWLAERENKNVAMGHNHLCGIAPTRDGRHVGIDIGACTDFSRTRYYQLRHSVRPKMGNGALVLYPRDDHYYYIHFTKDTDWEGMKWLARGLARSGTSYPSNPKMPKAPRK